MPRLPLAPPLLPDEALSSWLARIAARYDLPAHALVRHLLPDVTDATTMVRCLDYQTIAPLEAALAAAAGQPVAGFAGHRLTGPIDHSTMMWPRTKPAWCPICVVQDVAAFGEVHGRAAWSRGGVLLCTRHQCLLIAECPRCFHPAGYQPINGRLRIWCKHCEAGADTVLEPNRIPFWPYGTPQQRRSCVSVTLSSEARPLLLRTQTDILAILAGDRPRGPWSGSLPRARVIDVLRRLVFVMLGPLWEGAHQAGPAQIAADGRWLLSATWTPGALPPHVAAPALLAAVTFLAAQSGTRLAGIAWHRQLLAIGEDDAITAETLLWHLDGFNARLVRDLFTAPFTRPFAILLTALRADRNGLGTAREATRRKIGIGAAPRRDRESRHSRLHKSAGAQARREAPGRTGNPASRFSFSRLIEGFPAPAAPTQPRARWQEAVAVYVVIGWGPGTGDILEPQGDWLPELLRNRYIRLWLFRHRHLAPERLITTLANALDTARDQHRDIVLPELSAEPIEPPPPPLKPLTRGRPSPPRRSRGG
jgi:hypothetical protein